MRLRPILLGLVLSVPVAAVDVVPTLATVNGGCTITWYYRNGGYPYKMFSTCPAGPTHQAQRARVNCTTGSGVGVWQSQPGPWYGSTATCPGSGYAQSAWVDFYG